MLIIIMHNLHLVKVFMLLFFNFRVRIHGFQLRLVCVLDIMFV